MLYIFYNCILNRQKQKKKFKETEVIEAQEECYSLQGKADGLKTRDRDSNHMSSVGFQGLTLFIGRTSYTNKVNVSMAVEHRFNTANTKARY